MLTLRWSRAPRPAGVGPRPHLTLEPGAVEVEAIGSKRLQPGVEGGDEGCRVDGVGSDEPDRHRLPVNRLGVPTASGG